SASADGKDRLLLCLGVKDGKVLWTATAPGSTAKTHPLNTLASSTPATDGERIYALFWDGTNVSASAFDFKGAPLWNTPLGSFTTQHGFGASPVVANGKVYINNDQDGKAVLVALDAASGKVAWEKERPPFRACYSSPFLLERTGAPAELIVSSTGGVT